MMQRSESAEKRHFGRRPSNQRASIRIQGQEILPCLLSNVSDGGALIYLDQELLMPNSFRLTSEDHALDQIVEVRYQIARLVGVQFIAAAVSEEQVALIAKRAHEFDAWLDLTMR